MSREGDMAGFLATRLPTDVVGRRCGRISSDKAVICVMGRRCGRFSSDKAANSCCGKEIWKIF